MPSHASARPQVDRELEDELRVTVHRPSDQALDPAAWLSLLQGAGPAVPQVSCLGNDPIPAGVREDLQSLLCSLVRRVAWGGDRRKGSARLELSQGVLAGATVVVHAEGRNVTVELELPAGASGVAEWKERLVERLAERGFAPEVHLA